MAAKEVVVQKTRFSSEVDDEERRKMPARQSSSCTQESARQSSMDSSPRSTYWSYMRSGQLDHQTSLGDLTPGKTPKPSKYVNTDERDGERTPGLPMFKTPKTAKKGRYLRFNSDAEHKALVSGDRTPGRYLENCSFEDFFITPKAAAASTSKEHFFSEPTPATPSPKIKTPPVLKHNKRLPFLCCRSAANDIIVKEQSPQAIKIASQHSPLNHTQCSTPAI